MIHRKRFYVAFILVTVTIITYLHYSTHPGIPNLHNIFAELYYFPLFLGALTFGVKGAVLTYSFIAIVYAPFIYLSWSGDVLFAANQLMHALFGGTFAFFAGILVDREKKHGKQLEKDRYLAGLGQAAASIVHDLRNPLIGILGFAKRIRSGKGDSQEASQVIIDSAEDMQQIIGDVLDFARPARIDREKQSMVDIVKQACNYCSERAENKGVKVLLENQEKSLESMADRVHMQRALVNLINNAIEASPEGGTVLVRSSVGKNHLSIRIRDHGKGMDRETVENVFIPFYSRKNTGTGLGMAVAKKIIEAHEGEIRISSRVGKGTDVTVLLPHDVIVTEQTVNRE